MEINSFQVDQNSRCVTTLPSAAEIQTWMISYIAEVMEIDPSKVDVKVSFDRYGLDSSVALALTNELEEWLRIEIDPTLLYDYPTIYALAQHLTKEENN
jgi:acyl carrier protein